MSDVLSTRENSSLTNVSVSTQGGRRPSRMETHSAMMGLHGRRPSVSRRPSIAGQSYRTGTFLQPTQRLENTYRIDPDEKDRFHCGVVERMLSGVLESFLDGELYEARKCSQIAQNIAQVVNGRIKSDLSLPRYKFVSHVLIGQNTGQGINCASRSLWNTATDGFASATYRNGSLFAVATVFAAYYE